eukprot:gene10649-13046_t
MGKSKKYSNLKESDNSSDGDEKNQNNFYNVNIDQDYDIDYDTQKNETDEMIPQSPSTSSSKKIEKTLSTNFYYSPPINPLSNTSQVPPPINNNNNNNNTPIPSTPSKLHSSHSSSPSLYNNNNNSTPNLNEIYNQQPSNINNIPPLNLNSIENNNNNVSSTTPTSISPSPVVIGGSASEINPITTTPIVKRNPNNNFSNSAEIRDIQIEMANVKNEMIQDEQSSVTAEQNEKDNFLKTIKRIRHFKFQKKHKKRLTHYLLGLVPILTWIREYSLKRDLKGDIVAGLTVGVMLIPQSMAYAMVAGLPPIYGLYSSIVPVVAYAIFGTSKQLSVGPFAIISLLVSETVNREVGIESTDVAHRVSVSLLLAFVCGVYQIILGLMRFGFVANFLSDPVKTGFTSGCAIIIGCSQLKHIFGYGVKNTNFLLLLVGRYLKDIPRTNWYSFMIGIIGIILLVAIKKINKRFKIKIPGPLIIVILFTFISWVAKLEERAHIKVVGHIPSGLPIPRFPTVQHGPIEPGQEPPDTNWFSVAVRITPGALVLVLVGFISSVSIGMKFGEKYHYKVEPNQELISLGTADFFGSFFLSFPVGASLSRTAINAESAVSQIASLISTAIIIFSVLFLTPIIYFLPEAILASIVLVAVSDLVEYQMMFDLWKVHRKDLAMYCISFLSTTCFGILQGILIGMIASLVLVIYNSAYPPFAVLGRLPGTELYKNIKRVPKAETFKGIQVVRIDGSIYFANTSFIKKKLKIYEPFHKDEDMSDEEEDGMNIEQPIKVIIDGHPTIGAIVIDFSSVNDIDSTGIKMLKELVDDFRSREIIIYFASVKGYVRDSMKKGGVAKHHGANHFFLTINDAVEHHLYLMRQAKKNQLFSLSKSTSSLSNSNLINNSNSNNNNSNNSGVILTGNLLNNSLNSNLSEPILQQQQQVTNSPKLN